MQDNKLCTRHTSNLISTSSLITKHSKLCLYVLHYCNSRWTFGSRNSDLAHKWFAKACNTSAEYSCSVLDPLSSNCSKSVQRCAYVSCSSSTIILCNMMHDLMMIPKSAMSHKRASSQMILNRAWSTPNAHSMSFPHPSWYFANNLSGPLQGSLIDLTKVR